MHTIKDVVKQLIGKSLDAYNKKYTNPINNRIDNIVAQAGTDNTEIVDARIDSAGVSHTTLNNRILAETKMTDEKLIEYSGSSLSVDDTMPGYLQNIEIKGNTIQNEDNLEDIRSVGDKIEGQELYEIPILSCGKNLFNPLSNDIEYALHGGAHKKVTYKVEGDNIIIKSNPSVNSDWGFIEFKNIKVTPNKSYTIHPNATVIKGNACVFVFDSNNTKLFEIPSISKTFIPTTKHISIRLYVQTNTLYTDAEIHYKPQLEESTVSTEYEPYQEDKLTILSPVQLEKVGDVRDRIVCKDGVWGVDKNIIDNQELDLLTWHFAQDHARDNTNLFTVGSFSQRIIDQSNSCFSNLFINKVIYSVDEEGCYISNSGNLYVRILKNKASNLNEFKKFLKNNNVTLKYAESNNAFIPLPHDQQVKLRTFANKTNISFLTEIEGMIKTQVPKSLGATVNTHTEQISNLNNELDRVKKLEESTVSTVETESDFTTVEVTSNGYFEDVKLEGKTLVNLSTLKDKTLSNSSNDGRRLDFNASMFKAGTDYTLIMNVGNVANATRSLFIQWDFIDDSASKFNTISNVSSLNNSTVVFKFRQDVLPSKLKRVYLSLHIDDSTSCTCEIKECIVLEGDHTQNPPNGYIEGLKSVGQGTDEIVVSSVNENLVPSDWDYKFQCFGDIKVNQINTRNFEIVNTNTVDGIVISKNFINKFCHNNKVVFDFYSNQIGYFYVLNYGVSGENYKPIQGVQNIKIGRNVFVVDVNKDSGRIAFRFNNNIKNSTLIISDFSIKTSKNSNNINHQSDKKRLLYYNNETQTWEKPVLREWDSIEKHTDGKYYYHQRSGEVVLNGSEFWELIPASDSQDIIGFNGGGLITSSNPLAVICDKFPTIKAYGESANFENIFLPISTRMQIRISKSKLSTQDVEGFKQWLQANNVTVVYQLAQEKVYECTNIDLITYANETNYMVESGAIVPRSTLKVHNNISNVVNLLQKKVSLLESNMTKYMITQNRLMLTSRYNADSVTFKVDYSEAYYVENKIDEDLFNLLYNVIIVGKNNYDYDEMFNIISDYVSWNKITWEHFDILSGLMQLQYDEITNSEEI